MITFTDIDGVLLTSPCIGAEFAKFLLEKDLLSKKRWEFMKSSYRSYKKGGSYKKIIKAWNSGFREALRGKKINTINNLINEFEKGVRLKKLPYTDELINFLKQKGPVLGVTAAIPQIVHISNQYLNLDDILGLRLLSKKDNRYVVNKDLDEHNFKKHIVNRYKTNEKIIALGDSVHDVPMLKKADIPIALNPDHELSKVEKKKNWEIITKDEDVLDKVKNLVNENE